MSREFIAMRRSITSGTTMPVDSVPIIAGIGRIGVPVTCHGPLAHAAHVIAAPEALP